MNNKNLTLYNYSKVIFLFVLGIVISSFYSCQQNPSTASNEDLFYFALLDSTLNQKEYNRKIFDARVAELKQKCKSAQSLDAIYFYQKMLTEAYLEFEPDSALYFIQKNLDLAKNQNRQDWETECYIYKAQTYTSVGLLDDTRKELDAAKKFLMQKETKLNYYIEELDYWHNYAIKFKLESPYPKATAYADSIIRLEPDSESPYHLYARVWYTTDNKEKEKVQNELMHYADQMDPENIWYARMNECAGTMAYANNDIHNEIKYWTISTAAKFNKLSRHLPQLVTIGSLAKGLGEYKYASRFYNSAIQIQSDHPEYAYNGRADFSNSIMDFHNIVSEQLAKENNRNKWLNYGLLTFIIISAILFLSTIYDLKKRVALQKQLERNNKELAASEENLRISNLELTNKDKELGSINTLLTEANFLKEEYIGQLFATCSDYLGKMEKLKLTINRKLKANQIDDAIRLTDSKDVRENEELHELWERFDEVFLNLFPDFVEQFNGLLRPEERITLRSGEKLNTDLRIYALVRLGINSSVKIGKILGISTQTVYNARMKMRSRATESDLEFPIRVRQLKGKNPTKDDYSEEDKES